MKPKFGSGKIPKPKGDKPGGKPVNLQKKAGKKPSKQPPTNVKPKGAGYR